MIHVSPTDVVSFIFPPQCRLSSCRYCHTIAPCHTSFPWSQYELTVYSSSLGNASFPRLSPRTETEALNRYHHHRPSYPDRPTPTLHCYKKVNSTLVTLPTTQMSPFYIFPSQSITPSELHTLSSFSFTVIPRSSSLRTAAPTVIN
jgi:hypothetical protein